MTTAHFETLEIPAADSVLRWRFEQFLRSGYDAGSALILAGHPEVDLHDATLLLDRGCSPELALQIVL